MRLAQEDYRKIAAAIRAAEQKTSAEIVCVLAGSASEYSLAPPLWAAFAALAAPWPLLTFTHLAPRVIFAAQIAIFIALALLLSLRPIRFRLVPRRVKRARAHRAAVEQFYARGVGATQARVGVLIFVSFAERYARIVADVGLAEKIGDDDWRVALDVLRGHMRDGEIAQGFVEAVAECARIAAPHAPPGGEDELPNKIYVM
jgi:putative membrane protein